MRREILRPRKMWTQKIDRLRPAGRSGGARSIESVGGTTLVRLRHDGLPNAAERDTHHAGWVRYVSRLAERVA